MKKNNLKKAFTIPELLIIIAVIGIVASSLVLVWVEDARAKARDAKRVSELDALRTALRLYYMDNKKYPFESAWCSIEQTDDSLGAKCPNTGEPGINCLKCRNLNEQLSPYLSKVPGDILFGQGKEPKNEAGMPTKVFSYIYVSDLGDSFRLKADLEKGDKLEFFGGPIDPADITSGANMPPPAPTISFSCGEIHSLVCYINENEGFATITLSLSNLPPAGYGNPKVKYHTLDSSPSTASPGYDYTPVNGYLEFDGVDTLFFTVPIINDTEPEDQEFIRIYLTEPMNSNFPGQPYFVDLHIIDDDQNTISFSPALYDISEGAGKLEVSVVFEGEEEAFVYYYTENGTAEGGLEGEGDFQLISDQSPLRIDFEAGQTVATFTIDIYDDSLFENTEYFFVKLASSSPGSTLGQATARVNIIDNDSDRSFLRIIHGSDPAGRNDNTDIFYSVQTTSDGYIMAGKTLSGGIGFWDTPNLVGDIFVVKLSADLSSGWTKIIGSSVFDSALAIECFDDGSCILTGESAAEGNARYDIPLIKLDPEGEVRERKIIKFSDGNYHNSGRDIAKTADGGFILVGTTGGYSRRQEDILVIKFDSNMEINWAKAISKDSFNLRGYSIKQLPSPDEGYILTGTISTSIGFYPSDIVLIKLSEEGDAIEFQTQVSAGSNIGENGKLTDIGNSVIVTSGGEFVVVGSTDSFVPPSSGRREKGLYFLKFNSWGRVISSKKMYKTDISGEAYSVFENKDGDYIVNGYIKRNRDNISDLYTAKIGKVDSAIKNDNRKMIHKERNSGSYIYGSTKELADGGFVVVGHTTSTSVFPPFPDNAFVSKFDPKMFLDCPSGIDAIAPILNSEDLSFDETDPRLNLIDINNPPEEYFRDCSFFQDLTIERIFSEDPC